MTQYTSSHVEVEKPPQIGGGSGEESKNNAGSGNQIALNGK